MPEFLTKPFRNQQKQVVIQTSQRRREEKKGFLLQRRISSRLLLNLPTVVIQISEPEVCVMILCSCDPVGLSPLVSSFPLPPYGHSVFKVDLDS